MNIYVIWNDSDVKLVTTDLDAAKLKHEEEIIGVGKSRTPLLEVWNSGKIIDTYDYLYGWCDGKFPEPVVEIRTDFLKEVQKDNSLGEFYAFCDALGFDLLEESSGFAGTEMRKKLEYIISEIDLREDTKRFKELIHTRRLERRLIKHEIDVTLNDEVYQLLTRIGIVNNDEMRSDIANKAILNYVTNNSHLFNITSN